jgi:hypothetical protein
MEDFLKLIGGFSIGLTAVGVLTKKYWWPWMIKKGLSRYGAIVLQFLDELTDQQRQRDPDSAFWEKFDQVIDKAIEAAGIEDKSQKRF